MGYASFFHPRCCRRDAGGEFVGTIEESTDDPVASGDKGDDSLEYFKKLAEQ